MKSVRIEKKNLNPFMMNKEKAEEDEAEERQVDNK